MFTIRRSISYAFYISCLIAAAACFYFSIAESLFSWLHPDELVLSKTYNSLGFWGCTKLYYFSTTINRLSADFGACLMAKNAALFNSPFRGWITSRFIVCIFTPISLAYFLNILTRISFKHSIIISLLIVSIAIFIISGNANYLYGLDLAIYGTATISFFILSALFIKCFENKRYFKWFCLIYAINLMSHEVFIAISVFYIPLFAWYQYAANQNRNDGVFSSAFIKDMLHNKAVWILSLIYLASVLITILAPGMAMRQRTWPSNGNPTDSIIYALLALEEVFYFMIKNYILVSLVFILGVFFKLFSPNQVFKKKIYGLKFFLLLAPLLYILIVGFLMGLTPSLWSGESRTETFRIVEPILSHWMINKNVLIQGRFDIRQNWFLYISLYLNCFLAGFWLTHIISRKYRLFSIAPFLVIFFIFLLHPDGIGSLKILSTIFSNKDNNRSEFSKKPIEHNSEYSVAQRILPNSSILGVFSAQVFPIRGISNHNSSINNIIADNYFLNTEDKRKLPAILDSIYDPKAPNSIAVRQKQWMDDIYSLYKVFPPEFCISVSNTKNTNGYCYHTFGATNISKLLAHKKISSPTKIYFNETQNMEVKKPIDNCVVVVDQPTKGEHFIASNTLSLNKGLNYFIFETKPTQSQLYLYIFGEKRNLFLPWLNSYSTSGAWALFDNNNTLQPIFSQIENLPNVDKLKVVIYSAMPQKIHLRWQHGFIDKTFFKGFKGDTSSICKAEYGQIM